MEITNEPVRIDYDLMEVVPADHSKGSGQYTNESHAMPLIGTVETVVPLPLVHSDFEFVAKRLDSWSMGGLAKIQSAGQHIADPGIKHDMRQMSIGPGSESWPKVESVGYRDSLQLDLLNLKPGQQFEERIDEKGNRFYRIYDAVPFLPEEPVAVPVVVGGE